MTTAEDRGLVRGDQNRALTVATTAWGVHANADGLLYGALVTGAVVAVSGATSDSAVKIAAAVVEVLFVYWAAHVYIRVLADRMRDPSATFRDRWREALHHEVAVLLGGVPAFAVFVVAALLGAEPSRAADLALLTTVVLLGSAGYLVGRQARAGGWALAGEVAGASLLGLLVVGLKSGLH